MSITRALWGRIKSCRPICNRPSADRAVSCTAGRRPIANRPARRGSALLAVLWLSLALSAIAFSLASTVQGETERTSTAVDGLRSYYLATGAIERAILYMQWGRQFPPSPENPTPYYSPSTPVLRMSFPTGDVEVEVIPEAAKYNINKASPEDLLRLMASLGAREDRAR